MDGTAATAIASGARTPVGSRVLIVAEARLYREGLHQALVRTSGLMVVGTAASAQEASRHLLAVRPTIALIDLPAALGREAVALLRRQLPELRVVALAIEEVDDEVVAWAECGVDGYVSRNSSLEQLVATLDSVARDEMSCPPRIAATLFRRIGTLAARTPEPPVHERLSRREYEVVDHIVRGLSNKEIAAELGISLPTVKHHVHNIFGKLDVHRRIDAIARLGRSPQPFDGALDPSPTSPA